MVKIDPKAVAAGVAVRALKATDANASPTSVTVDGKRMSVADAQAALAQAEETQQDATTSRLERVHAKLEDKLEKADAAMKRWSVAEKMVDELQTNPERVTRRVDVIVHLADGRNVPMTIDVLDVRLSKILVRSALGVDALAGVPFIPFLGLIARGGAAAVAWASSVGARAVGNDVVADALSCAARKQAILAGFQLVPGMSNASGIVSAIANSQHLSEVRHAPTIGSVVSMPQASAP
jgi:hypothetical protein